MKSKHQLNYESMNMLQGHLIVSCQADDGEPLAAPEHIKALALSAINGGAKALRLEGAENIAAVRPVTDLPIIGLSKSKKVENKARLDKAYITASYAEAVELAKAGSDIIALDCTARPRLDGLSLEKTIEQIHDHLKKIVWADVSTLAEGLSAAALGADIISTTLFGYTRETELDKEHGPNFQLLREMVVKIEKPVILEGRVWFPEEVRKAFECGAYAVVVGSAITRPQLITQRFVRAIPHLS